MTLSLGSVLALFGLALTMTGFGIAGLIMAPEMPGVVLKAVVIIASIVGPTLIWMLFFEAWRRHLDDAR